MPGWSDVGHGHCRPPSRSRRSWLIPRRNRREPRQLVEDAGGARVAELPLVEPEPAADAPSEVADDLPVRAAFARGRDGPAHALHAPLAVREGALALGKGAGGQHDIGDCGRLVQEEVLHDEEVERTQGLLGVMQVGLVEEWVLADDVERADVARGDALDHVGGAHPLRTRQDGLPRFLEARDGVGGVALVAGQGVGDTAGVAAALHVVLAAEGETPLPGRPSCPVSSARLSTAWQLAVPCVCWVSPIPQTRHEPGRASAGRSRRGGGDAKRRAAARSSPASSAASSAYSSTVCARTAARHGS